MKRIVTTALFVILCFNIMGQKFNKGSLSIVSPDLISIDNFTPVHLENNNKEMKFDKQNPYTYILLINDSQLQHYQVLYQTDFWGDLNFIGLDNHIFPNFECYNNNWMSFWSCNKKATASVLRSVATEQQLNCIVERLNDCVER